MLLAPDVSLGSRYRLLSRIAVGGMGEVWRAEDAVLGRSVAIKVLRAGLIGDPAFLDRFRAEARHTAALSHPGIASVYDYGEGTTAGSDRPDTAYLVMELVDGEPLSALLAREGRLPTDRALDIVAQAAGGLAAAHAAGVVHRDIKPGNILIQPDGTVKITDFGIARAVDAAPMTATGLVMGTVFYLSPEQAGGQPVGPASDQYSLGVVAYEALAGRRPFTADNPVAVAMMHLREPAPALPADVPAAARQVVERAMAKEPAGRFASATDLGAAALAARAGAETAATAALLPPTVAMSSPRRATPRWPRPAVLLLGALLLVALIMVLAKAVSSGSPPAGPGRPAGHSPAPTTHSTRPTSVTISAGDYIGRQYPEVRAALVAMGLRVREAFSDGKGDGAPGTVTAVAPAGTVPPGSTITVTRVPDKKKKGEGGTK
ncbi:MAG: protein kinase [Actinomycetota bacterium]|nr:protein kinase [Actinomycetota bacterium]